jgi:HK97 family phage portal protein
MTAGDVLKRALGATFASKASAATKVILSNIPGVGPVEHYNYERLAKETYNRNVTVFACVKGIATNGSGVPWVAYQKSRATKNPGKARRFMSVKSAEQSFLYRGPRAHAVRKALDMTEGENIPLLQLLERPNPWQAKAAYMQTLISHFLLSGNAYEEFVAPKVKNAPPVELYSLRPDRTKVVAGTRTGELVAGYEYQAGASKMIFAPESVIHRKFFHPTDDFYGLSPLQAATRSWQTDNASADWNLALIKNQARPSGALVAPTVVGDDAYERLKGEIRNSYVGADSAGLPIFLEGGLEWKQFSFSPIELDWMEGRNLSKREICAAMNWPPELIGDTDARTYNSMPEARKAGWMEAILPILDAIRDEYNARLCPLFGDGLFIDYDRDQIDALAEDQAKVWERVNKATFISVNEAREAVGYETYDDPEADVPREMKQAASPFGEPSNGLFGDALGAAFGEDEAGKPGSKPEEDPNANPEDGKKPTVEDQDAGLAKALHVHRKKQQRLTSSQRRKLAVLRAAMKRFFGDQGKAVARHVADNIAKEL